MSENQAQEQAVVEVKLTRAEKLVKRAALLAKRIETDTAEYANLKHEVENLAAIDSIAEGTELIIKLGRKFADKDTTREVLATVVGVKENEDGSKQFKVAYGSGFDADVAVVDTSKVVRLVQAEAAAE